MLRKILRSAAISFVIFAAVVAGMIAFGGGSPPPNMASINAPFKDVDFSDVPAPEVIGDMSTHVYPGGDGVVAVLAHGSSALGRSMHPLAKALQAAGATIYAPDLPGHGANEPGGDVESLSAFYGALDALKRTARDRHPGARLVTVGFSSGGGVMLRDAGVAGAEIGGAPVDHLVLVAPMLGPFAPPSEAENPFATEDRWAAPYMPRIIGLSIANRFGVNVFNHLPVIGFAIQRDVGLTGEYSFRLMNAMNPQDYSADLAAVSAPVTVLVGERDEVFHAPVYAPTIHAVRPEAEVVVIPGMGHTDMTVKPEGLAAVVAAVMGE